MSAAVESEPRNACLAGGYRAQLTGAALKSRVPFPGHTANVDITLVIGGDACDDVSLR
jgi:hypothetical protein